MSEIINPGNIKVAEWTEEGLFIEEDKKLAIGTCHLRDAGESLMLFDRTVGGISLEEISKVCQGNDTGHWNPLLYVSGSQITNCNISNNYFSKIGNIVFITATITVLENWVGKITIEGIPYISKVDSQISGLSGIIKTNTSTIEITNLESISKDMVLSFTATFLV